MASNADLMRPVPSILLKFSESNRTSNEASEVCVYMYHISELPDSTALGL